jgi:hypothetical protein
MMQPAKNKLVTYLLICAVAMVWGIILYRVFFNDPDGDNNSIFFKAKANHEPFDQYSIKSDTLSLALNYRDPFLGKVTTPEVVAVSAADAPVKIQQPIRPMAPPINWEIVKYSGFIINPKTKKMIAIVTVNGQERMIAEGESFQGLRLIKNKKDSILVSWMGKQKYIKQ